ncbi:MAG: host attachment protein [Alphaproteobacteria bacterium]|nr:host attachment protein [Alphaproteobacteria bacterium]
MKFTGKIAQESLKNIGKELADDSAKKIPRIWILVADKHIAKIFRKKGEHLEFLGDAVPEIVHDDPTNKSVGRVVSSSGGSVHHKYEPHMDASQQESLSFARALADWLEKAVQEDAFDRFVLVAPPHILGDLRKTMSKEVHTRIVAEVNKELTKHDEASLLKELADIVWF